MKGIMEGGEIKPLWQFGSVFSSSFNLIISGWNLVHLFIGLHNFVQCCITIWITRRRKNQSFFSFFCLFVIFCHTLKFSFYDSFKFFKVAASKCVRIRWLSLLLNLFRTAGFSVFSKKEKKNDYLMILKLKSFNFFSSAIWNSNET